MFRCVLFFVPVCVLFLASACNSGGSSSQSGAVTADKEISYLAALMEYQKQSVTYAELVPNRAQSGELKKLAEIIKKSAQTRLIDLQKLAQKAELEVENDSVSTESTKGIEIDFDEISALTGEEFDTQWVRAMIARGNEFAEVLEANKVLPANKSFSETEALNTYTKKLLRSNENEIDELESLLPA